jgi:hypothetical protein
MALDRDGSQLSSLRPCSSLTNPPATIDALNHDRTLSLQSHPLNYAPCSPATHHPLNVHDCFSRQMMIGSDNGAYLAPHSMRVIAALDSGRCSCASRMSHRRQCRILLIASDRGLNDEGGCLLTLIHVDPDTLVGWFVSMKESITGATELQPT